MATLEISPASPLHFRLETGTGTIHDGEFIYNNYLYNETDVRNYHNCAYVDINAALGIETFLKTQTLDFQIEFSGTPIPYVEVEEEDGTFVEVLTQTGGINNAIYYEIDFTQGIYNTNTCYVVKIYSQDIALFTQGDDGTHEANVNNLYTGQGAIANNALAQSAAQAQTGTMSALITAAGPVTTIDHRFIYSNIKSSPIVLSTGDKVTMTAWVFIPSGNPFVPGNNINLLGNFGGSFGDQVAPTTKGWTDATNVINGTVDASVVDTWQLMTSSFEVGAVVSGSLVITSDTIPTANGEIYVDTVVMTVQNNLLEATSETIQVCTSIPCANLVTYTNDNKAFQIEWDVFPNINIYETNISFSYHEINIEDADYSTPETSTNSVSVNRTRPTIVHTCRTELLPPYKIIRLQMVMKCTGVTVNGVDFICIFADWSPEWTSKKTLAASVEFQIRPQDYDFQARN